MHPLRSLLVPSPRVRCALGGALAACIGIAASHAQDAPQGQLERKAIASRESWWAYRPLSTAPPPAVRDETWCRNGVDRFILAPIEAKQLAPALEADRVALLRRASFDLIGLPPTPEEVAQFLADDQDGAFERVLDRLLASEQYGVRWGRHWLDIVRYADTNGFERDSEKSGAWKYRDFVVDAFNADMPYAQFVTAQLAGDELESRDFNSLVATGFYRLGVWDDEVPDLAQAQADDMDGIVDTTARAFLGISLGCARCHDHKGDPIAQSEYYEFAAWFAGVAQYKTSPFSSLEADNIFRMVRRDFGTAEPEAEIRAFKSSYAELAGELQGMEIDATEGAKDDVASLLLARAPTDGLVAYFPFDDARDPLARNYARRIDAQHATVRDATFGVEGRVGTALRFDGGDDRVELARPVSDDFTISFFFRTTDVGGSSDTDRRWFRGKGFVDSEVPGIVRDFGISFIGNGFVSAGVGAPETFVSSGPGYNDGSWHHVAFTRLISTGEIELFVDGFSVAQARGNTERLTASKRIAIGAMQPGGGPFNGDLDEIRFYDRALSHEEVRAMARGLRDESSARASIQTRLGESAVARAKSLHDQLAALTPPSWEGETVLVVKEDDTPRVTHVMLRGSPHSLGAQVEPNVPAIAERIAPDAPMELADGASSGRRLALSRWITDSRNALAWRTIANRVWQHHFGVGLCPTPNDFGRLGELPTHPELLDFLATELIASGGSLKALHRTIMSSATYRMSSVPNARALADDAPNTLLTRTRMRRLGAEELRDAMLSVNGTLNPKMGGEPVRPPLPAEVLATASRPGEVWPLTPEESWTRRSLYIMLKRSLQHPLLSAFDLADLDSSCPVRFQTVVPTQALSMLNGQMTNEEARKFAQRLERECPGDLRAQVSRGRLLTSGRVPSEVEVDEAVAFMDELVTRDGCSRAAAMANFCLVLFNLNEFLYID